MSSSPPKATRLEWVGLAVLALPCILATMDLTVLTLAVPHLTVDLRPTTTELLWIMDIYGFFIAGSLITMGTLGDRIGRRKLLLMGAIAFGVASIAAAFSSTAKMLIFSRALLGVAGATLAPSTLSLIRNMFLDNRERTVAVGIWVTCFSVGAAIGPLLGGVVLEHFWWGAVFLLNVPVMILLLILGPLLLPEFRDPQAGRLDFLSAGMSLLAVLLMIYGLKIMAEYGVHWLPVLSIVTGSVIGWMFVRRQKILADPLIDLRLFRVPAFGAALFLTLFGCFVAFGVFFFTAQYLQFVLGLSPLQAGLWSLPSSVAFIVGSMLTPRLVRWIRPAYLISSGLLVAAVGYGLLIFVRQSDGLLLLVVSTFISSLGISPIFTLATDLVIGSAPVERAGAAASISETCTEFGGAVGMAVLGTLGMAFYRKNMADHLPAMMSAESMSAAQKTVGGAVAVAKDLPADVATSVLSLAYASFGYALHAVGFISVIVVLLLAVVSAVVLKSLETHKHG